MGGVGGEGWCKFLDKAPGGAGCVQALLVRRGDSKIALAWSQTNPGFLPQDLRGKNKSLFHGREGGNPRNPVTEDREV